MKGETAADVLPVSGAHVSRGGFREAAVRLWPLVAFGCVPVLAAWIYLSPYADQHALGLDFKGTLWEPAQAILDGRSPYPDPSLAAITNGAPAVYPPPAMLAALPLGLLPWQAAAAVWAVLLVAGVVAALRLLGVHDWRCYAIALVSTPVLMGVGLGNLSIALVPLAALAWRYRDRWLVAGCAVGTLAAAKIFLWPLALWFVLTRRYRAAVAAALSAAALLVISWAAIGFRGLADYPQLIRSLDRLYAGHSYSLVTLGRAAGIGRASSLLPLAALAVVISIAVAVSRKPDADRSVFALAVVASLAATPVLWPHTLALLLVPIAVISPRLGPLWFAPLLLWVAEAMPSPETATRTCCRPADMSPFAWTTLSGPSALVPSLGAAVLLTVVVIVAVSRRGGSA